MLKQEEIVTILIPILKERGTLFAKFSPITARKAATDEFIQTFTSDGLETENKANEGDFIVKNQTKAGELYIIGAEKFNSRYEYLEAEDETWGKYQPTGKAWGIEVTPELIDELNWTMPYYFTASWGSAMVVKTNDYLVCPLDFGSVYRIARQEFFETYQEDQS